MGSDHYNYNDTQNPGGVISLVITLTPETHGSCGGDGHEPFHSEKPWLQSTIASELSEVSFYKHSKSDRP